MAVELYKPHLWMKAVAEAESILHVVVRLADIETLGTPTETPDDVTGTLTLTYQITGGGAAGEHDEFVTKELHEPIYENVVVMIDGGVPTKKGKSTGQQSEGDTSGYD